MCPALLPLARIRRLHAQQATTAPPVGAACPMQSTLRTTSIAYDQHEPSGCSYSWRTPFQLVQGPSVHSHAPRRTAPQPAPHLAGRDASTRGSLDFSELITKTKSSGPSVDAAGPAAAAQQHSSSAASAAAAATPLPLRRWADAGHGRAMLLAWLGEAFERQVFYRCPAPSRWAPGAGRGVNPSPPAIQIATTSVVVRGEDECMLVVHRGPVGWYCVLALTASSWSHGQRDATTMYE